MNHMIHVWMLTILLGGTAFSSVENNGRGTRAIGLANAFVALSDNPWALYYNPAGIVAVPLAEISAFLVPQQFGMNELRTVAIAGVVPTAFGTFAAGISQFGFSLYRETEISLGFGRRVDWGVSAGFVTHVSRIFIDQYGTTTIATVDVGVLSQVQEQVAVGFSYKNLLGAGFSSSERLPQVFALGATYRPVPNVAAVVELEKDVRHPLVIKAGVEQTFLELLTLRAGVSNNPDKFSAGFGVRYSAFEFSYAGYSHAQLGWTHQIELTFRPGL
jgi:opacity protein-like surface antigen